MSENKITRLAVQKRNPKRVNVYLDNIFAFSLNRETAAWLSKGQILSDEKIRELSEADQKTEVYLKAVDYISCKPRTVRETRKKLLDAGYDEVLIADTLSKLSENGLLNDKEFADQWIEERQQFNPKSKRALEYELRKKGIPDHLIQSAVDDVDDYHAAYATAKSRLYRYEKLSEFEFRKKMGSFLAGRGFNYDVISTITRKLWKEIRSSTKSHYDMGDE